MSPNLESIKYSVEKSIISLLPSDIVRNKIEIFRIQTPPQHLFQEKKEEIKTT